MLFSLSGISLSLLIGLCYARPFVEPWVSCQDISRVLNKIDQSHSTVLASKFYVRGIKFYTDRPMAVIDINGEGFFSAHPIPFLNTDQKVLEFLNSQATTYAIVKHSNVDDLKRIIKDQPFTLEELDGIGGKFIIKIKKKINLII